MTTVREIERQLRALVEDSIEDARVPDTIAAHADRRAGKPVTRADAEQLEAALGVPVRIRREHDMTHVTWGWRDERSILLANAETNVRWPSGAELRQQAPAYFGARADRNGARQRLLREHASLREALGDETPNGDDESAICRAARAIAALRAARAALEDLLADDQPLHVVRFDVEKLAGK